MNDIVIKAHDVRKSFGPLQILKGISLEVSRGEIVAIIGASGAGKTTLLQILGTLDRADEGRVEILGKCIGEMTPNEQADFRNNHIGFVFQFHQLLPEFTAQENVALPAMIAGQSRKEAMTKARDLLYALNLSERLTHKPNALSGGEKQRVAVARALVNDPVLIFADEPSGALDSEHKEELHLIFKQLRDERQQTFVIVTHDDTLAAFADKVIRLKDGGIV